MKKNLMIVIHTMVLAAALVLIAVSSSMAYSLSDLNRILLYGGIAAALDLVMLFVVKKDGLLRDIMMLGIVVLTALCLCRVLAGRADLMGYVWFSDLEKGNPTAVASLNLAVGAMGCFLVAEIMTIAAGFRKSNEPKQ